MMALLFNDANFPDFSSAILVYLAYKNAYEDWKEHQKNVVQAAKQVRTGLSISCHCSVSYMDVRIKYLLCFTTIKEVSVFLFRNLDE